LDDDDNEGKLMSKYEIFKKTIMYYKPFWYILIAIVAVGIVGSG